MIDGKRVLALIPARGGSKGVPRKNVRMVSGKPLIAWTIDEALKSRYIDRLILSSDCDEIIQTARRHGCDAPFVRPETLGSDAASSMDVILHALSQVGGYDYLVLLQPTSPLRIVADIDKSIELCLSQRVPSCVSVTDSDKSPFWMYTITDDHLKPIMDEMITQRQEGAKCYALNGAVYVIKTKHLLDHRTILTPETVPYVMPQERSIDIDTEHQLEYAEWLLNKKVNSHKRGASHAFVPLCDIPIPQTHLY